jgi:hypothetical protein
MERNRVTVQEAARILGVKEPAIRKRIKRRTLQSEREEGRVYVYLDTEESPGSYTEPSTGRDELIDELRDQVQFLRRELERKDAILLRMAERIPELEAASETPEAPESVGEEPTGASPPPEPQETTSRPWWRRVFGG